MAAIIQRLFEKKIVGIKTEGTARGTYAAPTQATDLYAVYDLGFNPNPEAFPMAVARNTLTLDTRANLVGAIPCTVTFKVPLQHKASVAPALAVTIAQAKTAVVPFLVMAGMKASGTYSYVFDDTSAAQNSNSYSMLVNHDGVEWQIRGCAANVKIVLPSGQPGYYDVTVSGIVNGCSEAAVTTLVPSNTFARQVWEQKTITIADGAASPNTFSTGMLSLEFDFGNTVVSYRPSLGVLGLAYYHITRRFPSFSATCTAPYVTTTAMDAELWTALSGSQLTTIALAATTTTFGLSATSQLDSVQPVDSDGLLTYALAGKLSGAAGEDEITLTWGTA